MINIPKDILTETRIYHITHIDNLEGIIKYGEIYSKNHLPNNIKKNVMSIANEEVQIKRSKKIIENTKENLHSYVPFYFAPRSPMLLVNHSNGVQREIIYLVTRAQDIGEGNLKFIFSDRHPVLRHAQFFTELSYLNEIKWEIFFEPPLKGGYSEIWNSNHDNPMWVDRKEIRQAEFLVFKELSWEFIRGIATINEDIAEKVKTLFNNFNVKSKIVIKKPEWYY